MSENAYCFGCGWYGKQTETIIGPVDKGNLQWLCCPKCYEKAEGADGLPILYPKELREGK